MKRFLLALAVFLTATVTPTFAGYIIIRVLLDGGTGDPGAHAGPGGKPPGMSSGPGSLPGYPPGSMPQSPGTGPGSTPKTPPKLPGGVGQMPPGYPGSGKGMSGAPEAAHGGELDPTRSVVVVVPLETDLVNEKLDKAKNYNEKNNPKFRKFVAPYNGKMLHASLFVDSTTIQLYEDLIAKPAPMKTRHTEMLDKYAQWLKGKKDPQLLYDALLKALESGYIREPVLPADGSPPRDAVAFAQELLALAATDQPLPAPAARFVAAWGKVAKAVRGAAPQPSSAEYWRSKLDAEGVRNDGHYALIYFKGATAGELSRRSRQLNDNFIAFYLLHATRGATPPVPDKPLVAVLLREGKEFHDARRKLDGMDAHADAFFAPEYDLLVLSPDRIDGVGRTFIARAQSELDGFNPEHLLAGQIPPLDGTGKKGTPPNDVARATTYAVVRNLAFDEAEIAAVSHEGTRQLLFATDTLPKHVVLPNWLTSGAVDSFARPRGPAYVTMGDDDKPYMHVALTTGYGVPNYVLHRYFRDLDAHKELGTSPARLLENVLTDAYFAGIKNANDPDPSPPHKKKKADPTGAPPKTGGNTGKFPGPGMTPPTPPGTVPPGGAPTLPGYGPSGPMTPGGPGKPGRPKFPGAGGTGQNEDDGDDPVVLQRKKRDRLTIKAQATAWALYFYLAREKPDQLRQFVGELNKLPRDLPIDGQTAHEAFVRVFGLSSSADEGQADPNKMKKFATEWLDWINKVTVIGFDIQLAAPEPPKDSATDPKGKPNPKGPMGPMGGIP